DPSPFRDGTVLTYLLQPERRELLFFSRQFFTSFRIILGITLEFPYRIIFTFREIAHEKHDNRPRYQAGLRGHAEAALAEEAEVHPEVRKAGVGLGRQACGRRGRSRPGIAVRTRGRGRRDPRPELSHSRAARFQTAGPRDPREAGSSHSRARVGLGDRRG